MAESSHESYFDPIALLAEDAVSGVIYLSHQQLWPWPASSSTWYAAAPTPPRLTSVCICSSCPASSTMQ